MTSTSTKTPAAIAADAIIADLAEHDAEVAALKERVDAGGVFLAEEYKLRTAAEADRDRLAAELEAIRGAGGVLTREECLGVLHALPAPATYDDIVQAGARAQQACAVARVRAVLAKARAAHDHLTPAGAEACLAALTSDAEPVAAAAPTPPDGDWAVQLRTGSYLGPNTETTRASVPAEQAKRFPTEAAARVACEGWYHAGAAVVRIGAATTPPLALTAEDREALGRAAFAAEYGYPDEWDREDDEMKRAFTGAGVALFTLGAEAAFAAVQSEGAVGEVVDVFGFSATSGSERAMRRAVAVARRSLRVEAKASPGFDLEGTYDAVMAALGYDGSGGPEMHALAVVADRDDARRERDFARDDVRHLTEERDAARRDLAQCQRDLARTQADWAVARSRWEERNATPAPADLDGYVRVYEEAALADPKAGGGAQRRAGIAAVLAAFARAVETDAAVGAAMDATGGTRAALRAAVEAALGAKVEPAYVEPAPLPPLPEVPEWMRRERADAADGSVAALLVDLVDALRARGGP